MIMQINGTAGFSSSRLAGIDKTKTNSNSIMLDKQEQNEEDSQVKNLQSQINAIRERIQEIGENEEMDPKSKAELRQSYQEQMTALQQQLSNRRAEARREKMEKEQEKTEELNNSADRTSSGSSNSKRKYDTFERDGGLSAAVSAFNSVDLAKIHQSAKKTKEGKANILEREADADTRLVQTKGVVDHETKLYGMTLDSVEGENGESTGPSYRGPVTYEQLEAWDEQGVPYRVAEYTAVIIGEEWHGETGEAVDAKLEELTELRNEAEELTKDDAKALGEANRKVDGKEEDEEDKTEVQKAEDTFNKAIIED